MNMRKLMVAAAATALGMAAPAWAQSDGVSHKSEADIASGLSAAMPAEGVIAVPLPMGDTTVISVRRAKDGAPEAHQALDDVLVGQKGGPVVILVGGTLEGAKEISPGEPRGGRIVGARRVNFGPGDVIRLPAGVPHQMLVPGGEFRYLAFKLPVKK